MKEKNQATFQGDIEHGKRRRNAPSGPYTVSRPRWIAHFR